jgi:hypothetical protein
MASLHSSAIIEYVPLYLDGSLSYISSHSFRPSLSTLKPLDLILNTAFILLSLHSLLSSKALSSRQVLCLLAALDTSFSCDLLVYKDSRSLLTPHCSLYLHHSTTRFFTHSLCLPSSLIPFTYPLHFFLFLHSSLISIKRQNRDKCLHSLITRYSILEVIKRSKWY